MNKILLSFFISIMMFAIIPNIIFINKLLKSGWDTAYKFSESNYFIFLIFILESVVFFAVCVNISYLLIS